MSGPPTVAPLDHPMSRAIIRGRLYFALYLDPILRCSPLTPSPGLTHCSNRTNNFFLLSFFPLLFFERTVSLRYPLISNSSRSLFREIRRLDGRLCVTSSCCEEQFWGREVMIIRGREEGVRNDGAKLSNRSVNKCCVTIVYSLPYSTLSFLRRLTRATCMALRRRQIIRGVRKWWS